LFKKTAESMSYEIRRGDSRAAKNCIFCGHCADRQICKYDSKMSTLVTHAPIAQRNGVEIIANARAQRVIIERSGGKAVARGVAATYANHQEWTNELLRYLRRFT